MIEVAERWRWSRPYRSHPEPGEFIDLRRHIPESAADVIAGARRALDAMGDLDRFERVA